MLRMAACGIPWTVLPKRMVARAWAKSQLEPRMRLLRRLPSAGLLLLVTVIVVLMLQSLLPAFAAYWTGAFVGSVTRAEGGGWLPLALLGTSMVAGHLLDASGSALRFLATRRIDGAQRAELTGLGSQIIDLT